MAKSGDFHPVVKQAAFQKIRDVDKFSQEKWYLSDFQRLQSRKFNIYLGMGGSFSGLDPTVYVGDHSYRGFSKWMYALYQPSSSSVAGNDENYFHRNERESASIKFVSERSSEPNVTARPAVESLGLAGKGKTMSGEISRAELDAKLDRLEIKIESKVSELSKSIQSFLELQQERDKRYDDRFADFSARLDARDAAVSEAFKHSSRRLEDHEKIVALSLDSLKGEFTSLKKSVADFDIKIKDAVEGFDTKLNDAVSSLNTESAKTVASFRKTSYGVILSFVAIGATIVLGIWGANSTIIGSARSLMDGGREFEKNEQALNKRLEENQQQLIDIQGKLELKIDESDKTMKQVLEFISRPDQRNDAR